jgi:hypothetical protein
VVLDRGALSACGKLRRIAVYARRAKRLIHALDFIALELLLSWAERDVVNADSFPVRERYAFLQPAVKRVFMNSKNLADLVELVPRL